MRCISGGVMAVALGAVAVPSVVYAQPLNLHLLAATGHQIANGSPFQRVGRFPFGNSVSIAPDGRVVFIAGFGSTDSSTNIYEVDATGVRLIARDGTQAPGYPGGMNYGAFRPPMQDGAGRTAFFGEVFAPGAVHGIWRGTLNGVSLVIGAPPAPNGSWGVNADAWSMNRAGEFTVTLGSGQLHRISEGVMTPLLLSGDPVPGHADLTFTWINRRSVTNNHGVAAVIAESGLRSAVVTASPGSVGLLGLKGEHAAGFEPNMVYNTFHYPTINDAGTVVFTGGAVPSGTFGPETRALWYGTAGNVSLLARHGDPAPGTPSGVTFGVVSMTPGFWPPVINGQGTIAFGATLRGPGVDTFNNTGIWMGQPDQLELVARAGDLVPGASGSGEVRIRSLQEVTINSAGDLAFPAVLVGEGITTANDGALFARPAGGSPLLVVQTGDELEVLPGVHKTISRISLALGSGGQDGHWVSLHDSGLLAFQVRFTDGTGAVVTTIIPAPAASLLLMGFALAGTRRRRAASAGADGGVRMRADEAASVPSNHDASDPPRNRSPRSPRWELTRKRH